MKTAYRPISCEFHDRLEAFATTRKVVALRFRDAAGAVWVSTSSIADLFSRDGEEYLRTSRGVAIRLDRLIDVDGIPLQDSCETIAYD